jgi:hypothetical protein
MDLTGKSHVGTIKYVFAALAMTRVIYPDAMLGAC